ncbi:hypothetical protein F4801DRAFT_497793 [Xylaria longipes]|nr:hypothetical protein F4801DRAFT_497793 [Xylaria longipes]RYC63481.1 hypothetical protein CHU98_g2753 [Xylaria longipes]
MAANLDRVTIDSGESEHPTENELYMYPWKYIGYKGFSTFAASDPDFFALRRFDRLHTRTLFSLQDELSDLERQLNRMDERFSRKSTKIIGRCPPKIIDQFVVNAEPHDKTQRDINNGTIRDDLPERKSLIANISAKLKEYDEAVLRYSEMRRLFPAPDRNVRNLQKWFENNEGAILKEETEFIKHRDELISISTPKSTLRRWFEDHIITRTDVMGVFKSHARLKLEAYDQTSVDTFSDDAINTFGSMMVFAAALVMLITPLWILQSLEVLQKKLAAITVFIVVFLAFLTATTIGRPFERLVATAGYAAVLVVFLQLCPDTGMH